MRKIIYGGGLFLAAALLAGVPLRAAAESDVFGSILNALGNSGKSSSSSSSSSSSDNEQVIQRAYEDYAGRAPTSSELSNYRSRMIDDNWTEQQVRADVRSRQGSGSSTYSGNTSASGGQQSPERMVRRAYRTVLGREPDASGMRTFRSHIIDDGWTEQQVCEALRSSGEFRGGNADVVIQRAYQDILGREPDEAGMQQMRAHMLNDGWTEQQVRANLRNSPEGKQNNVDATIQRAYQDILGRDADAGGLAQMRQHLMNEGWSEQDMRNVLSNSPEAKQRRQP